MTLETLAWGLVAFFVVAGGIIWFSDKEPKIGRGLVAVN